MKEANWWKVLLLAAVVPLFLGHALTENFYDYVIGGAPVSRGSAVSDLQHHGVVDIFTDGKHIASTPGGGESSVPISFVSGSHPLKELRVEANSGSDVGHLGELWLWYPAGRHALKLSEGIAPLKRELFYGLRFRIDNASFSEEQYGSAVSGVQYVLSADRSAGHWMAVGTKAEIYLNGSLLVTTLGSGNSMIAPVLFNATAGDVLRFRITGDGITKELTQFWLHNPSGSGRKLLHRILLEDGELADVAFHVN